MKNHTKFALSITARSLQKFGVLTGLRVASQLLLGRGTFSVRLPGYTNPILVRQGTSDAETFEKVFIREEYDHTAIAAQLIIDLGGNVGYASVFFANKYPSAKIYCIEPETSNFEVLKKNTGAYPNVVPLNAAIWNKKAQLVIKDADAEKWATQVHVSDESTGPGVVEALTIPDLQAMASSSKIDLLKIDIESAELELFSSGYEAWLGDVNLMIIELHDRLRSGCSTAFYRAVTQYEFDQYINGENTFLCRRPGAEAPLRLVA